MNKKVNRIIGKVIFISSMALFSFLMTYLIIMKFVNIDFTEMRFFVTYWKQMLGLCLCAAGACIGLNWKK